MLEIIENGDHISSSGICNIDFGKLELSKSYVTSSNWTSLDGKICNLNYTVSFSVTALGTEDKLIYYGRRLELKCIINNIEKDALEVIDMKRKINHDLFGFICENGNGLVEELSLTPIVFGDRDIQKESDRMKSCLEAVQLDSLDEEQRRVIRMTLPV